MDALEVTRRRSAWLVAPLALVCAAAPAWAQEQQTRRIDIASGRLSERVPQLARQAGISISVTDGTLWRARVKGVKGVMSPAEAIARMLSGTNSRAVQLSATSWRIDAMPAAQQVASRAIARPPELPLPTESGSEEAIIVTASKLDLPYRDIPGIVHMIEGRDIAFGGERGTDAVLSRLASVASTHLGSGRNKLFIRGIADSSFTGPTQATVGQYFGDLRLSYNAPDPDLRLHDIQRVEILEGSQGTLYGAGSLGGIIRLVPNDPDPRGFSLSAVAGISATQHGAPGGDIAATLNVPLGGSGHALRFTGYGVSEGGYIDNPLRGENDVNRSRIGGGRAALRLDMGDRWTVDVGGIYQATGIADSQYADRDGKTPLTRYSPVVEDADAHYGMAMIVVRKDWGDLKFQSSNAYVSHGLDERFNATRGLDTANVFAQRNRTTMWVSETRLWRPVRDGLGWVVGVSAIDNSTQQRRAFEQGGRRTSATGVTNSITEFTAYGKLSVELSQDILLSGGGRVTHSRLGGAGEDVPLAFKAAGAEVIAERNETQFLPSAEVLVRVVEGLTLFARYEQGFRPGGLAIEGPFVRPFRNDHVESWEGGARWSDPQLGLAASLSVSHAYWRDIQADFIDGNGLPTTANIGDGRITSVAGSLTFYPIDDLRLELNGAYNHSRVLALTPEVARLAYFVNAGLPVTGPSFGMPAIGEIGQFGPTAQLGKIPNVAEYAVQGSIDYRLPMGRSDLRLGAWFKYLGPSRLGIGPVLGDEQGDYVDTGLQARLGDERRAITLSMTNVLDTKGNRFAMGTPFDTSAAGFVTPQRPRTIRIAVDYRY